MVFDFFLFVGTAEMLHFNFSNFDQSVFFSYIVIGLTIIGLADFQPFSSRSISLRYRCINSSMTEDCKLMLCTSVDLFLYDRELGCERDKKPGRQRLFHKKKLTAKICELFSQKSPSWIFNWVLNTSLCGTI